MAKPILAALGPLALSLEHVGSTSVPGLAAKPILDMDIVLAPEASLEQVIRALSPLGYRALGDLGIAGREAFSAPAGSPTRHNLYACRAGSTALRNHIAIRDYLLSHPGAVLEYGRLKYALARAHAYDGASYSEAKTGFLIGLLRQAGFAEDELAAIAAANKKQKRAEPGFR